MTGVSIAGYTFFSGLGVKAYGSFLGFAAWLEIFTGPAVLACAFLKHKNAFFVLIRRRPKNLAAGVLAVTGYGIALWAMTRLPVPIVAALRGVSIPERRTAPGPDPEPNHRTSIHRTTRKRFLDKDCKCIG